MPTTKKRVGKEEAKSLFLKYYNNSSSSMVRDINTKAKTLKPNSKTLGSTVATLQSTT